MTPSVGIRDSYCGSRQEIGSASSKPSLQGGSTRPARRIDVSSGCELNLFAPYAGWPSLGNRSKRIWVIDPAQGADELTSSRSHRHAQHGRGKPAHGLFGSRRRIAMAAARPAANSRCRRINRHLGQQFTGGRLADRPRVAGVGRPQCAASRDVIRIGFTEVGQRRAVVDELVLPGRAQIPDTGIYFNGLHPVMVGMTS